MNDEQEYSRTEKKVQDAFHQIQPDPAFSAGLRSKLQQVAKKDRKGFTLPRWSFRLAMTGLVLVFLAGAILVAGPQTLLARARALFGFIPGVGFVEAPSAYQLCQPVQTEQNGIVFKIERGGGSNRELHLAGSLSGVDQPPMSMHLEDENGQPANISGGGGGGGGGSGGEGMSFDFDFALPTDGMHWTFVVQPYPDQNLVLRLPFELCTGVENTAELYQNTYAPANAVASRDGIKLQVVQVSQSDQVTAVQLKTQSEVKEAPYNPQVYNFYLDPNGMPQDNIVLSDPSGKTYPIHPVNLINSTTDPSDTAVEFDPLPAGVLSARLTVQTISLLYKGTAPFTFDPQDKPRQGQTWDLKEKPGNTYHVDEFQIEFLKARYGRESVQASVDEYQEGDVYEFTVRISSSNDKLRPGCPVIQVEDARFECMPAGAPGQWSLRLIFLSQPSGAINGSIGQVNAGLDGPWILEWNTGQ